MSNLHRVVAGGPCGTTPSYPRLNHQTIVCNPRRSSGRFQKILIRPVSFHLQHRLLVRGQVFHLVVRGQLEHRRSEARRDALVRQAVEERVLRRRGVRVEERRVLRSLLLPPRSRTDDALDEIAHGEEQEQDENARQFTRDPADVVEEGVQRQLAAVDGHVIVRAASLVVAALEVATIPKGLTGVNQESCQETHARPDVILSMKHAGSIGGCLPTPP